MFFPEGHSRWLQAEVSPKLRLSLSYTAVLTGASEMWAVLPHHCVFNRGLAMRSLQRQVASQKYSPNQIYAVVQWETPRTLSLRRLWYLRRSCSWIGLADK